MIDRCTPFDSKWVIKKDIRRHSGDLGFPHGRANMEVGPRVLYKIKPFS